MDMPHVIYKLTNTRKKSSNELPYQYIGSKKDYIDGKYFGSSRHPSLKEELVYEPDVFIFEILEYVSDPGNLTSIEKDYQLKFDVINDKTFYNLRLAGEKFSSTGWKWYYNPSTYERSYFPPSKIPYGWIPGTKPTEFKTAKSIQVMNSKFTGLAKGSKELNNIISESVSSKEWVIKDPDGKIHIVTKLHRFCEENKISGKLKSKAFIGKTTKSGWSVLEVRNKKAPEGA